MKIRFLFLLAPLLAVVGLLAPAEASSDSLARGGVVGGIVTHGGVPVGGAHVMIEVEHGGVVSAAFTTTDRRGRFVFHGVMPGHGVAKARHPRAGRDAERFVLRPGGAVRLHLDLH